MAKKASTTTKKSVYEMVTDRIIEQLKQGNIPWQKPWFGEFAEEYAYNRVSKKPYSLLNQLMLGESGEWATYAQWLAVGAHVKKGEKSRQVVFWKVTEQEHKDPDTGESKKVKIPYLKYSNVFHISQVEGDEKEIEPVIEFKKVDNNVNHDERIKVCDELIKSYLKNEGIRVLERECDEAYYSPAEDVVNVPKFKQFYTSNNYYATVFHELTHSTGHKNRLDRFKNSEFGNKDYSFEELIAELGSAYILSDLGVENKATQDNNAAYIESWIKVLENDPKMIVRAASAAEKAVHFMKEKAIIEEVTVEDQVIEEQPAEEIAVKEPEKAVVVAMTDDEIKAKAESMKKKRKAPKKYVEENEDGYDFSGIDMVMESACEMVGQKEVIEKVEEKPAKKTARKTTKTKTAKAKKVAGETKATKTTTRKRATKAVTATA